MKLSQCVGLVVVALSGLCGTLEETALAQSVLSNNGFFVSRGSTHGFGRRYGRSGRGSSRYGHYGRGTNPYLKSMQAANAQRAALQRA
ncbi:MAG TPA: hypothetical protein VK137_07935, partial [Planctomycetaceae bacterium]|nr:hypothetical protein [Planctomycetaceae bacterium]